MDPTVIQAASAASEHTANIIARVYSAGLLLRRPPPPVNENFVDKLYGGLARLIDEFPAAYVAAAKNAWLIANNAPAGAAYGGPPVVFKWAPKANRLARLMQLLDGSYDEHGVYALTQASRPDVPANFNAFAPYGLGAFTWPWTAPCDDIVMGMSSAYWKPDAVAHPVSQVPWNTPSPDFSYASTIAGFGFMDFAEDAPALRTCRNAWSVLSNWVWTTTAMQVAGSAAELDSSGSAVAPSVMYSMANEFPVESMRFQHKSTCTGYYLFDGEDQQYCQSSNIPPSPMDGVVKAIKLATAGYL